MNTLVHPIANNLILKKSLNPSTTEASTSWPPFHGLSGRSTSQRLFDGFATKCFGIVLIFFSWRVYCFRFCSFNFKPPSQKQKAPGDMTETKKNKGSSLPSMLRKAQGRQSENLEVTNPRFGNFWNVPFPCSLCRKNPRPKKHHFQRKQNAISTPKVENSLQETCVFFVSWDFVQPKNCTSWENVPPFLWVFRFFGTKKCHHV